MSVDFLEEERFDSFPHQGSPLCAHEEAYRIRTKLYSEKGVEKQPHRSIKETCCFLKRFLEVSHQPNFRGIFIDL